MDFQFWEQECLYFLNVYLLYRRHLVLLKHGHRLTLQNVLIDVRQTLNLKNV
eukprot:UN21508